MTARELIDAAKGVVSEIDRIARDYDHYDFGLPIDDGRNSEAMESVVLKFADAIAASQREACAKVIEGMQTWRAHDKRHEIADDVRNATNG